MGNGIPTGAAAVRVEYYYDAKPNECRKTRAKTDGKYRFDSAGVLK